MKLKEYKNLKPEEKLANFIKNLSLTNKTPDYFINWEKVYTNTRKYELHLNTMNYLIDKENIIEEATNLFTDQPYLLEAIPSLLASRDSSSDFLLMEETDLTPKNLNFNTIDESRISEYVNYMAETGLLTFIQKYAKMSLVDYVYGVEAGLDSNARKNRSGSIMEDIVENFIIETSKRMDIEYITQATDTKIKKKWSKEIPVDKSSRRFDFAIYNNDNDKLFLIEVNYYNGGGSKLKAVAGEFSTLNQLIDTAEEDVTFIWITDGQGWKTASAPLLEAFHSIEYIFNLNLLSENIIDEIVE